MFLQLPNNGTREIRTQLLSGPTSEERTRLNIARSELRMDDRHIARRDYMRFVFAIVFCLSVFFGSPIVRKPTGIDGDSEVQDLLSALPEFEGVKDTPSAPYTPDVEQESPLEVWLPPIPKIRPVC